MAFLQQIKPLFEKSESKNKLLRTVAGGGVDQLSQLQARWDKFEIMMESHELMVREQVGSMSNKSKHLCHNNGSAYHKQRIGSREFCALCNPISQS